MNTLSDANKVDLLRRSGEALYGSLWQSELARALGVNLRSMQRWSAGEFRPPPGIWLEISGLLAARQLTLAALAEETLNA